MYEDPDDRLSMLAEERFSSESDALAALLEATAIVNASLAEIGSDPAALAESENKERVRRWIQRLHELARRVADEFGAATYEVSVGLPGGVSVSVTWST